MSKSEVVDVSIVIPSYNRAQAILENVPKCLSMRPRPREIILVDDGSDGEAANALENLSRREECVRYIRLEQNRGQATSRSIAFAAAQGKYVVSLDDDSWFMEQDGLLRVWRRMEELPRLAILGFNLFSPGMAISQPEDKVLLVSDHLTCGAAYRTDVLRKSGYHLQFLRFVGEESDLSLKVRNLGFEVAKDMNIRAFHDYDPSTRSRASLSRVCSYGVRNDLVRTVVYFPLLMVPLLLAWKMISHMLYGIRKQYLRETLDGYIGFVRLFPSALAQRSPISVSAAARYLKLRRSPEPYAS